MANERCHKPKDSMRESDFALMLVVATVALLIGFVIGEAAGRSQARVEITRRISNA